MNISNNNNVAFKSGKVTYIKPNDEQDEITYKDGQHVWIKKTEDGFRISEPQEYTLPGKKNEGLQRPTFIDVKDLVVEHVDKNTYVHYNAGANSSEKLKNVNTPYFTGEAANRTLHVNNVGLNGKLEVSGQNYDFDTLPNVLIKNIEAQGLVKSNGSASLYVNNINKGGTLNAADNSGVEVLNNNGKIFTENKTPNDLIYLKVANNNADGHITIGKYARKGNQGDYDVEIDTHKGLLTNFASNLCNIRNLLSTGKIVAAGKNTTVNIESLDSSISNGKEFKESNITLRDGADLTTSAKNLLDKRA